MSDGSPDDTSKGDTMRNALTIAILLASTVANARPHKTKRDSAWLTTCIQERTGPTGGVTKAQARAICAAEQPDDEVESAHRQLVLARLNAKVAKAKAHVRKAIEACEQAVVDRCVELAPPDGSVSCEDDTLRNEFHIACLTQEGK